MSKNIYEHREMVAYGSAPTACPSNRYPWAQIIAELEGEDMPRLVRKDGKAHVYVVTGAHLESVESQATADALGYDLSKVEVLPATHAIWKLARATYDEGVPEDA